MNWDFILGYLIGLVIGATVLAKMIEGWKKRMIQLVNQMTSIQLVGCITLGVALGLLLYDFIDLLVFDPLFRNRTK